LKTKHLDKKNPCKSAPSAPSVLPLYRFFPKRKWLVLKAVQDKPLEINHLSCTFFKIP
jgi:hypothetical protein